MEILPTPQGDSAKGQFTLNGEVIAEWEYSIDRDELTLKEPINQIARQGILDSLHSLVRNKQTKPIIETFLPQSYKLSFPITLSLEEEKAVVRGALHFDQVVEPAGFKPLLEINWNRVLPKALVYLAKKIAAAPKPTIFPTAERDVQWEYVPSKKKLSFLGGLTMLRHNTAPTKHPRTEILGAKYVAEAQLEPAQLEALKNNPAYLRWKGAKDVSFWDALGWTPKAPLDIKIEKIAFQIGAEGLVDLGLIASLRDRDGLPEGEMIHYSSCGWDLAGILGVFKNLDWTKAKSCAP